MATQNVRMHGPALVSNVAATKYTAPTGYTAVLQHIHVHNPSNAGVTFTMSIGVDAASQRIYDSYTIGGLQSLDVFCKYTLSPGEILQAFAGTNNILILTLDGVTMPAPLVVGGLSAAFSTLYEVDFRTLPNQSLAAAGSHIIDGKTWWLKGTLGDAGVAEVVNGQGLHLTWPFAAPFPTNYTMWRAGYSSFSQIARTFLLPMANLPGYNPKAPLAIMAHIVSANNLVEDECYVGVIDHAQNANQISRPEHQTQMGMNKSGTTSAWWTSLENANTTNPGGNNYGPKQDSYVTGVIRLLSSKYYPLLGQWNGSNLTKPEDYDGVTLTSEIYTMPTRCSDSPSFFWGFSYTNSGQPAINMHMTHLKIMQPK